MPPKAADMRSELRALRKEAMKPISKMRCGDISQEIEKLKAGREETPAAVATPSGKSVKSKSAVESIKAAKASEFPVMPASEKKAAKAPASKAKAEPEKKKSSKMAKLLAMMEELSDSD